MQQSQVKVVIPPKSNRKVMRAFDTTMYKWRHLIENYFCKLKEFKPYPLLTLLALAIEHFFKSLDTENKTQRSNHPNNDESFGS